MAATYVKWCRIRLADGHGHGRKHPNTVQYLYAPANRYLDGNAGGANANTCKDCQLVGYCQSEPDGHRNVNRHGHGYSDCNGSLHGHAFADIRTAPDAGFAEWSISICGVRWDSGRLD